MAKIIVDDIEFEAPEGQNLLQAVLSHKLELSGISQPIPSTKKAPAFAS